MEQQNKFKNELVLDTDKLSQRDHYIGESSGTSIEGGALNANYREVDAVAHLSNKLGQMGYIYGKDWYWEDSGCDELTITYNDKKIPTILKLYI
jgi:hypothetical protein